MLLKDGENYGKIKETEVKQMEQKKYGQIKILSLDGSRIRQSTNANSIGISVRKENGTIDYSAFEGYLDESLETIKLEEIYSKHRHEFKEGFRFSPRATNRGKQTPSYTLALINVSFKYAVKTYRSQKVPNGYLFIREGYNANLSELEDHILIGEEGNSPVLVAVEVPYTNEKLGGYQPVENPIDLTHYEPYFEYDEGNKCYRRAEKTNQKGISSPIVFPSKEDSITIRNELYQNGFLCDGVRYVRYKRSAGSSRDGQCLFIPEILYPEMMEWSSCGIDGKGIADQASFQAYISLTLSSIKQTVRLSKKSILIIPDQESEFVENAVRVYRNEENNGLNAELGKVKISNKIWDGEALLDESVFAENGLGEKGMMLLRNRFFKTCAFNTRLQKWFADNHISDIKQLNGCHRRGATLSDIKMVITESSLKYCKMVPKDWSLQKTLDAWMDNAFEGNSSDFGLVKTEQPTDVMRMDGRMVRTNYQLLNTVGLGKEEVGLLLSDSFDFLHHLMEDPAYLRYYISLFVDADDDIDNVDATTINYRAKAVSEMLRRCDEFAGTKFFSDFRGDVLNSFKKKMKKGRIPINGTYATLFGNGAEFLHAVIQKGYKAEEPLALQSNEIRTTQYGFGVELLCARSPHITMGNLFLARNVDNDIYRNYFNFEKAHEIVCINAIKHNIQHRLNGCDYDSDTMLITDNRILLEATKRDEKHFPVPVADFTEADSSNVHYNIDNPIEIADLDRKIAENRIGEIVNLSQFLNSLYWDQIASGVPHEECKDLYADICKLAVLSGIEIDKAKRSSKVDTGTVLSVLQKRKNDFKKKHGDCLPTFYTFITADSAKKSNCTLKAPMSFIYDEVEADRKRAPKVAKNVPLSNLVALQNDSKTDSDYRRKKAIRDAADNTQRTMSDCNIKMRGKGRSEKLHQREVMDAAFEKAKKTVANNLANDTVLSMILEELDHSDDTKNSISSHYALLFALLIFEKNHRFLDHVIQNAKPQYDLIYTPNEQNPDVRIFGYPHIKRFDDYGEY